MRKLITAFWLLICALIIAVGAMLAWLAVVMFSYGLWQMSIFFLVSCLAAAGLALLIWGVVNSHHRFPEDWSKKDDIDT